MFVLAPGNRRLLAGLLGLLIATVAVIVVLSGGSSPTTYYLALGDSLSVGVQPAATGASVLTDAGYVNDLYVHYRTLDPHLKLIQMGCPGDTTESAINGRGNAAAAQQYHCDRRGGSQLTAALAFLRTHRGQVKLITVDLGTNDVDACLSGAVFARGTAVTLACIRAGQRSISANEPRLLDALRHAVAPGTALASATIYDPFLSAALLRHTQYGATAAAVARASAALIRQINSAIAAANSAAGFSTADVAGAFRTYDRMPVASPALGGTQPLDLIALCAVTWACAAPPRGPNIHPNPIGYRAMASAFEAVLPRSF